MSAAARSVALASLREIAIARSHGEDTTYHVTLVGRRDLALWPLSSFAASRAIAERLARIAGLPLREDWGGVERVRGFEDLDLTLGQRLRARGARPAPVAPPAGSTIRVRTGAEVELRFPAQPFPRWNLLLLVPPLAAGALILLLAEGRWVSAVIPLWFWAVPGLVFYAGSRRSTSLRVGPEEVVAVGRFGGRASVALERVEDLAADDGARDPLGVRSLWLLSDRQLVRVPYDFEDEAERAFVTRLLEQASYDHPSASRPPPPRAPAVTAPAAPAVPPGPTGPERATAVIGIATEWLARAVWPVAMLFFAAMIGFAGWLNHARATYGGRACAAVGEVVQRTGRGAGVRIHVRFEPEPGAPRVFSQVVGAGAARVGDRVPVLYDARDPLEARLARPYPIDGGAVALAVFCLVGLVLITAVHRSARRDDAVITP